VAPSSESKKSFESPANQSSVVEDALADLLAGPFDKVSITIPAGLRARVSGACFTIKLFPHTSPTYLPKKRKEFALIEFLDQLDEEFGPPSAEQLATADLRWEEMWQRYESSTALS